jgi:hypothetical protein
MLVYLSTAGKLVIYRDKKFIFRHDSQINNGGKKSENNQRDTTLMLLLMLGIIFIYLFMPNVD